VTLRARSPEATLSAEVGPPVAFSEVDREIVLRTVGLTKRYGRLTALANVSTTSSPSCSSPKEAMGRSVTASRTGWLSPAVSTAQILPLQKSPYTYQPFS
jgi:hypothetical protein